MFFNAFQDYFSYCWEHVETLLIVVFRTHLFSKLSDRSLHLLSEKYLGFPHPLSLSLCIRGGTSQDVKRLSYWDEVLLLPLQLFVIVVVETAANVPQRRIERLASIFKIFRDSYTVLKSLLSGASFASLITVVKNFLLSVCIPRCKFSRFLSLNKSVFIF